MRSDNSKLEHSERGARFSLLGSDSLLSGIQESLMIIPETQGLSEGIVKLCLA